jgi:hypothetical protein
MEIQNIFLSIIWLSSFLVLCAGALWMLKVILDSVTLLGGMYIGKNAVGPCIEEIGELDLGVNAFSDVMPEKLENRYGQ